MADDYERLTEKAELSYEEALALKGEMRKREKTGELAADLVHPAMWHISVVADIFQAVTLLNAPPRTQPGEASVTNRPDGMVDVYWFGAV
jgi:hypothetical protein